MDFMEFLATLKYFNYDILINMKYFNYEISMKF